MTIPDHIKNVRERSTEQRFSFPKRLFPKASFYRRCTNSGGLYSILVLLFPEFSLEGRRVDFALCHPANRPAVFVEVKKVGGAKGADKQLFEYAFHSGVPMAILTDGQEWSFYLPGEQGRYDERRVYKLDLLERNVRRCHR